MEVEATYGVCIACLLTVFKLDLSIENSTTHLKCCRAIVKIKVFMMSRDNLHMRSRRMDVENSTVQSLKCIYSTNMLPLTFPPLLRLGPPDDDVRKAFQIISASYNNSLQFLLQDHDPLCLHLHLNQLQKHILPLHLVLSTKVHHAD